MTIPQRAFGPTKWSVPVIGQGTWNMEGDDEGEVLAALGRGIDLGATHIDTAEMYGGGAVERLVGRAVEGRRQDVFIVSKVLPYNASRRGTIAACEKSLRRLRTDYLDCYLLHWPGSHPLDETLGAFEQLERDGKIRSFGVSNFDAAELGEAIRLAGRGRIACNQVLYHLGERRIEHEVLPLCEKEGIAVVGYSPFASGDFVAPRSRAGRVLAEIASRHDATARQVALAFLTRRPALFAIPKASRVEHVEQNVAASGLELSPADLDAIDATFPRGRPRRGVPIL